MRRSKGDCSSAWRTPRRAGSTPTISLCSACLHVLRRPVLRAWGAVVRWLAVDWLGDSLEDDAAPRERLLIQPMARTNGAVKFAGGQAHQSANGLVAVQRIRWTRVSPSWRARCRRIQPGRPRLLRLTARSAAPARSGWPFQHCLREPDARQKRLAREMPARRRRRPEAWRRCSEHQLRGDCQP